MIIYYIFSRFLDDFTGQNIEMIVLVLESCGQFLSKNKESAYRFNYMLDQINKLRKSKIMTPAVDMQIENALMVVKPTSKVSLKPKRQKSDLEEYVRFLFFEKLNNAPDVVAAKLLT